MTPPRRVYCPSCKELVFESNAALSLTNLDFTHTPDGRRRWYSRDFGMVVHQCGVDIASVMEITVSDIEEAE